MHPYPSPESSSSITYSTDAVVNPAPVPSLQTNIGDETIHCRVVPESGSSMSTEYSNSGKTETRRPEPSLEAGMISSEVIGAQSVPPSGVGVQSSVRSTLPLTLSSMSSIGNSSGPNKEGGAQAQVKPKRKKKSRSPEAVITTTVCQLQSASQFSMDVQVGDRIVEAVVDTAAEATIISDKLYDSLTKKPKKVKSVTLLTAGRKLVMQGFIAGPVRLRIGEKWYEKHVYVAPIQLDMLLGFDILYQHSAIF